MARIGSLDLAAAWDRPLVVLSSALSVPSSLSISAVTARYPFDRLEGVFAKESWRCESCIVNTSGVVNVGGIVSACGIESGSEIEGWGEGARESDCMEQELAVEMRIEDCCVWKLKIERSSSAPAVNVNVDVNELRKPMIDLLREKTRSCPQALMDYFPSCYTSQETINVDLYYSKGKACNKSDHPK